MVNPVKELITAADGQRIACHFFIPERDAKGAVLIVPAMGTGQQYYFPFAEWLAKENFLVATFDYRGTGESRSSHLRGFKADIFDWARLDCRVMVDAVSARAPGRPLYWIGH